VGIGLVVISAAGYGSGSILAAPIYSTGVDWLTLVSWRFLIGAVLGWFWVLGSPHRRVALRRLGRRQLAVALGLGALFVGNSGTYYASLETVPAALAGVVVYTYPVMVAVLSLGTVGYGVAVLYALLGAPDLAFLAREALDRLGARRPSRT